MTKDEKHKLLALPSVAACIDAGVEFERARYFSGKANKKAFNVLRRKGLSEAEADRLLQVATNRAVLERLFGRKLEDSDE